MGITEITNRLNASEVTKEIPKHLSTSPHALLICGIFFGIFGGGVAAGTTFILSNHSISWVIVAGVSGFTLFFVIPCCTEARHKEVYGESKTIFILKPLKKPWKADNHFIPYSYT